MDYYLLVGLKANPLVVDGNFSGSAGVGVQDFGTAGTYAWIDMSGGDDADVVLQLPTVDVSNYNQDALISFEYYSSLAPYTGFPGTPIPNSLFLEFSQDQGSTWTIIGTYDQYVNGWTEVNFILDLANFTAPNTLDLRFRGENNGYSYGFYNDIALDNVSVSELPSCPFSPTGLTASNITATSFDLDWTAAYNETSWVVDYVAPGVSPGLSTGNSILVTTNPATITGLTEKTSYDVYVRAFCAVGDSSDWSLVVPVTTASSAIAGVTCTTTGAISSAIFTEEFDANSAGWTGNINTGNGSWEVPNASASGGTGADAAHSGTSFMNFEGSDTLNNQGSIYSPEIDLTAALDDVQLSFWMHGYGNTMGTLNVSVVRPGTDTTVVFTSSGQTHASGSMPWWNIGVDLSTYIGETVKLAFTQIDDQDYTLHSSAAFRGDMSIDLVQVTTCAACSAPGTISASNLTSTSADISWVAGGSETTWNFEYGAVGYNQVNGTSSIVSTNPTTSLTGLTANTSYDVYVQSDCGGATGTSVWTGPFTFTTLCDAIAIFPYTMNFDNGSPCWNLYGSWLNFTANGIGGSPAYGVANNRTHDDHLVSPQFIVTADVSDRFSLSANAFGADESYEILVSNTGFQISDFTDTLLIDTTESVSAYQYNQVDLSAYVGQSIYVAIHAVSDTWNQNTGNPGTNVWYTLFDNIRIDGFNSVDSTTTITQCDSYTWSVDGNTYTSDTSFSILNSAVSSADFDTTFVLNLTINNSDASSETVTACESYTWSGDGNTYNASGNYVAVLQTVDGCDSTATLVLTINSSDVVNLTETACDSYNWNGSTYTTSGNQTFTTTNAAGCDSVVNLVLTINNSSSSLLATSSCNSYDWNGTTYSSSGVYENISVNSSGCTQTDTLDLTITTSSTSLTQSSCDSFSWNGTDYTTSGTYYSASGTLCRYFIFNCKFFYFISYRLGFL